MDDEKIIQLYYDRSEDAIKETEAKYGRYLYSIAFSILSDEENSRECVNDALLRAWNSIPPAKPQMLQTFLGKIVRNLSLNRWQHENAKKRGSGCMAEIIEELGDLSDGGAETEQVVDSMALSAIMRDFVRGLEQTERMVFMKRYWRFMSMREIASDMDLRETNVRVMLHRTREKLRKKLREEGFDL